MLTEVADLIEKKQQKVRVSLTMKNALNQHCKTQMIMMVAVDTLMAMNLIIIMYKLCLTMMGLLTVAAVVNGKSLFITVC